MKPKKHPKKKISLRLDEDTISGLNGLARRHDCSLSAEIRSILEWYVADQREFYLHSEGEALD
jgi:predicted DNA-binding protein